MFAGIFDKLRILFGADWRPLRHFFAVFAVALALPLAASADNQIRLQPIQPPHIRSGGGVSMSRIRPSGFTQPRIEMPRSRIRQYAPSRPAQHRGGSIARNPNAPHVIYPQAGEQVLETEYLTPTPEGFVRKHDRIYTPDFSKDSFFWIPGE